MDFYIKYESLIFLIVIAVLLYTSYIFAEKGRFDERRRSRFRRKTIMRKINQYSDFLKNDEYELFFKRNRLPSWINSQRLNLVRITVLFVLIVVVAIQMITKTQYLTLMEILFWGMMPIILIPKKPYPLFWIITLMRQKHYEDISEEIYQLYNEIKTYFQEKNSNSTNTYFIIHESLSYYDRIRPTLEKMLPYLEKKQLKEAWNLFEQELSTNEATMLRIVMQEVESMDSQRALGLLEQKRDEITNSIYNRYTDYLRRRKEFITIIVFAAALMVFLNELVVFYIWYKDSIQVFNYM